MLARRSGSIQIRIAYLRPEHVGVADAVDPLEDVGDVDLAVIVQEVGVVPAVGRDQVDDADHVGRRLLDRHAVLLDLGRELGLGRLHPVLDVDGGHVLRVADVERGHDVRHAVAGAVGVVIDHPLGAVDLLLDRRGDGPGDAQGVGPGVGRGHLDLGRGDLGILRDRQQERADPADQEHQEGRDRGEDRPADEEVDHDRRAPKGGSDSGSGDRGPRPRRFTTSAGPRASGRRDPASRRPRDAGQHGRLGLDREARADHLEPLDDHRGRRSRGPW